MRERNVTKAIDDTLELVQLLGIQSIESQCEADEDGDQDYCPQRLFVCRKPRLIGAGVFLFIRADHGTLLSGLG